MIITSQEILLELLHAEEMKQKTLKTKDKKVNETKPPKPNHRTQRVRNKTF